MMAGWCCEWRATRRVRLRHYDVGRSQIVCTRVITAARGYTPRDGILEELAQNTSKPIEYISPGVMTHLHSNDPYRRPIRNTRERVNAHWGGAGLDQTPCLCSAGDGARRHLPEPPDKGLLWNLSSKTCRIFQYEICVQTFQVCMQVIQMRHV